MKEVKRIYSRAVESEICPGFKDAVGVTPADFLGNLNSFLDDEDSADADILKKMVVDARVNVGVPEALDKSLVEIRDLLSRFIVYREDDPSSISNRVCPACAITVPRGFCYCTACKGEFISTGKFEPSFTNVTEEVKQAQREAKEDAGRFVAEEEQPDTQEMSEERSVGRSYIASDIDDEDVGVCPDNPKEDADAIVTFLVAILRNTFSRLRMWSIFTHPPPLQGIVLPHFWPIWCRRIFTSAFDVWNNSWW